MKIIVKQMLFCFEIKLIEINEIRCNIYNKSSIYDFYFLNNLIMVSNSQVFADTVSYIFHQILCLPSFFLYPAFPYYNLIDILPHFFNQHSLYIIFNHFFSSFSYLLICIYKSVPHHQYSCFDYHSKLLNMKFIHHLNTLFLVIECPN